MKRAIFALLLAVAAAGGDGRAAAVPRVPNIVYILADDLGFGDVQSLNPKGKIPTPHLDRLAAGGLALTNAHSSSAVCTPSRYSILTGRYAWRSNLKQSVLGGFSPPLIEDGRLTVAELLRRHGYATAIIGKWHLGLEWATRAAAATGGAVKTKKGGGAVNANTVDFTQPFRRGPTTRGFDEFFGIIASLDMPPYAYLAGDRITAVPTKERTFPWIGSAPEGEQTRPGPTAEGFDVIDVLPELTRRSVDFIARRANAARAGKPFFLYLPLASPHTPIVPTAAWRGKSGLNDYADFVMQTDAAVGEVLAALERHGLTQDTLVIFTSDNGCSPEANFHFLLGRGHDPSAGRRGHKADVFEGGTHVPLLVRWPARIPAGRRSDALIGLGDFMATCAEILGVRLPDNAGEDSVSFLPLLTGQADAPKRDTLVTHSINGSFAIRQGPWKLALCADSGGWSFPRPGHHATTGAPRLQLFNLERDPVELQNVVAQHPEIVRGLVARLRVIVEQGRSTPGAPQTNAPAPRWPQIDWNDLLAP